MLCVESETTTAKNPTLNYTSTQISINKPPTILLTMVEQFNEQQVAVLRKMADALIFQQSAGYAISTTPTQSITTTSTVDPEGLIAKMEWKTTKHDGTPSKFPWAFADKNPEVAAICKAKTRNTVWLSTNHVVLSEDGKFLTLFPNKKVKAEADK